MKRFTITVFCLILIFSCSDKPNYRMVSEMNDLYPIEIIYFDSDTERELGPFPVKRSVYGDLIEIVESRDPALVILKFFLDSESEEDEALAEVIGRYGNVFSQASLLLEPLTEPSVDVLDNMAVGSDDTPVSGPVELVAPNQSLFDNFTGVGLVDFTGDKGVFEDFPVYVEYQGWKLPSLALISAAFLIDEEIRIEGKSLWIGPNEIVLQDNNEYLLDLSEPEALYPVHLMIDVLNGNPRNLDFKGKVIIVFIDNPAVRSIKSEYDKLHNPAEIIADSINTLLKDLQDDY